MDTTVWEEAYSRFETPEQEIRKFRSRLVKLGAAGWPKTSRIVEIFCGRGNGLHALAALGFRNLEGIDLSPRLIAQYRGPASCYVGDCRQLPFAGGSKDIVIVQGGLHHLETLPHDLDSVLAEVNRVLAPDGRFIAVEPWSTPFLRFVHAMCNLSVCRRMWNKIDALATMIEHERSTYEQWLGAPDVVSKAFSRHFEPRLESIGWGKRSFVGAPKPVSRRV